MPYTVNLLPIDIAGFIGLGPSLGGTFSTITPTPAVATAVATAAATTTLTFPTATPPPPGVATVHVTNSTPTGDLFRSGLLTSVPPSPGTVTAISFPTSLTSLSATALAARVATVGRIPITPPGWVVGLVSAATAGTYIPLGGAITGIVPTLNTPAGTVTFTVTGFFTFRTYYFFTDTVGFTGTLTTTPAPSGDPTQPGRILSLTGTTTTLTTTTTGPSPTLAVLGWFLSLMAPAVGGIVQPQLENAVNQAIDSLVAPGLASLGFIRSPTSVVSARRVVVTGSGLGMSLVLADLLGPAVTPVPGTLRVQITPTPRATQQTSYTVTVTNTATGSAVPQATVTLHNFTSTGAAQTIGPLQTDGAGQAKLSAALRGKVTSRVDPVTHQRERVFLPPTLTVSRTGFSTVTLRLLEDPADV